MDRDRPGFKLHVLSDAAGLPLVVGVSAGNTHGSHGLIPVVSGLLSRHAPDRERHTKPKRLCADKAYDRPELRRWLRGKRITPRIARKGIDAGDRGGRYRWAIESTFSWLSGYRRLAPRYERDPRLHLGFLDLAASPICYKQLTRHTT